MYHLTEDNKFVIENYMWETSFSNFFPGIAGKLGIPIWIYYVSRGQCICSMGIKDKDNSIMEFLSFNKALEVVAQRGFRTFIKLENGKIYEPFVKTKNKNIVQKMIVSSSELQLMERNKNNGLQFEVLYYPVVKSSFPALVRTLEIYNTKNKSLKLDVIDGLPKIIPYGVDFATLQTTARHIEGMMAVFLINGIPVFRLKIRVE